MVRFSFMTQTAIVFLWRSTPMKFIVRLRVWVNGGLGKTSQVFPRFRGSANRRVDLHLPLIASIPGGEAGTLKGWPCRRLSRRQAPPFRIGQLKMPKQRDGAAGRDDEGGRRRSPQGVEAASDGRALELDHRVGLLLGRGEPGGGEPPRHVPPRDVGGVPANTNLKVKRP